MEALPPPYRSSKEIPASPYDPHDSSLLPYTYVTELPSFDLPRRHNDRLRRLLQQRSSSRGVYLTLHIPHSLNNCKLISIESASTCSSSSTTSSSSSSSSSNDSDSASISTAETDMDGISENLIHYTTLNNPNNCEKVPLLSTHEKIPFIEDLEPGHGPGMLVLKPRQSALKSSLMRSKSKKSKKVKFKKDPRYRHRDRHAYGYIGHYEEDKETSWLTFFLLLLLVFTMVCAAGVFIAWALGFAGGKAAAGAAASSASGAGVAAAAAGGLGKAAEPMAVAVQDGAAYPGDRGDLKARGETSRVWRHLKRDVVPMVDAKIEGRSADALSVDAEEYMQNTDLVFKN
ncbi:hypothetical protein ABW20_dc0102282 [Dactylellina cionopaga]|nr:hypothetical protein ABW20_dc0102282 [Dactylellina cionopaga]